VSGEENIFAEEMRKGTGEKEKCGALPGGRESPGSRRHNLFIIDEKKKKYFIRKIREWGKKNFILYPWREEKNIYRLLLTEIFLQKTDSLKIKELYPLIKGIEGPGDMLENEKTLDYIVSKTGLSYKKERILYLSRQLLENFNGEVPSDYRSLRALKGVGDYIANAILTFGFKRRAAIVDTNTIRIVESFFGFCSGKKRPRDDRGMNEFLLSILPQRSCDSFNYYLFIGLWCIGLHQVQTKMCGMPIETSVLLFSF
jgi:A/G-specific adenine glycosylase